MAHPEELRSAQCLSKREKIISYIYICTYISCLMYVTPDINATAAVLTAIRLSARCIILNIVKLD